MGEITSTYEINYPEQTTYFIAYEDTDVFSYGQVTSEQCMSSGQTNLFQTTIEQEWLDKLKTDFNVDPYAEDTEEDLLLN